VGTETEPLREELIDSRSDEAGAARQHQMCDRLGAPQGINRSKR
jgi:hypothetical protein